MKRAVLVSICALAVLVAPGCTTSRLIDFGMNGAPHAARARAMRVGGRLVLAGDMHAHVLPPDAPYHVTRHLEETIDLAEQEGLDFVIVTPHVSARFYTDEGEREWVLRTQAELRARIAALSSRTPDLIIVPGFEYTDHRYGHVGASFADVNAVLADVPIERAERNPELFFVQWLAHGGVLTINHPVLHPTPGAAFRQLHYDMSWRGFTRPDVPPEIAWITDHAQAVETFNMSLSYLRDRYFLGDGERSIREASHVVDVAAREQGRRIAPVGGTDSHGEWLRATTFVLALARTREAIRDAILEGRTCVRGPEACSLAVRAPGGAWHHVGEGVAGANGEVEAVAEGGDVRFVVDGAFVANAAPGVITRLAVERGRCSLVRAVVGRSWSAPVYVGCPFAPETSMTQPRPKKGPLMIPPTTASPSTLAEGRRWTAAFYARDTQPLWDHFAASMKQLLGDKDKLDAFRATVDAQLGAETSVLDERVEDHGGERVYVRIARFAKRPERIKVVVGFDAAGAIAAFGVRPADKVQAAPTTKLDYRTKTPLRLPFDGAWTVAWGGRTIEQNQHAAVRDQRFAYDFVVEENGTTHRGTGASNEDYFCYGRPILAPGAGRVAALLDGVAENVPGQMSVKDLAGNYVILDHGDGEYSLLAHLVPGSIAVKVGDAVKAGQTIGRCGNSGHSSEPHLHYHLQDTPRFGDADGLPAQFEGFLDRGSLVARGEPVRGDVIEQPAR